jgi:hypothetical protein
MHLAPGFHPPPLVLTVNLFASMMVMMFDRITYACKESKT